MDRESATLSHQSSYSFTLLPSFLKPESVISTSLYSASVTNAANETGERENSPPSERVQLTVSSHFPLSLHKGNISNSSGIFNWIYFFPIRSLTKAFSPFPIILTRTHRGLHQRTSLLANTLSCNERHRHRHYGTRQIFRGCM